MADSADPVRTMRLRYRGRCAGCGSDLDAGTTAHYLRAQKTVRCLPCGPHDSAPPAVPVTKPPAGPAHLRAGTAGPTELVAGRPTHQACDDCGRQLGRGDDAVFDAAGTAMLCLECVTLDAVHVLGTPGHGARREHAKRLDRHQTRVKARHPRLGPVILALADDPQHVTAWARGAEGEEDFGRRLTAMAGPQLKVLHDRKLPRSSANIDHLVVTPEAVWVIDAKRYKGRVETRGGGLLSRRPPELYVGGRNQQKLVNGVQRQVQAVQQSLDGRVPVRGALVFIGAEFGLLAAPVTLEGIWIGWGSALRKRLRQTSTGPVRAELVARTLAADFRNG